MNAAFAGVEQAEYDNLDDSMGLAFEEQADVLENEQEKKRIYEETNIYHEDFKQQLMEYCHYY